eukprot:2963504-Pleurochrysis_carterae.AAC.1
MKAKLLHRRALHLASLLPDKAARQDSVAAGCRAPLSFAREGSQGPLGRSRAGRCFRRVAFLLSSLSHQSVLVGGQQNKQQHIPATGESSA